MPNLPKTFLVLFLSHHRFCSEKLKRSLLRHIFLPLLSVAQVAEIFLSNLFLPVLGTDRRLLGRQREQICGGVKQRSSAAALLCRVLNNLEENIVNASPHRCSPPCVPSPSRLRWRGSLWDAAQPVPCRGWSRPC